MRISFIFGVACAVLNVHKTFAYLSIDIHLVAQVLPRLLPGEQIALSQVVFPIVGGAVFLLWEGWYFLLWESFLAAAGKLPGSWQFIWQVASSYLAGDCWVEMLSATHWLLSSSCKSTLSLVGTVGDLVFLNLLFVLVV